MRLIMYEGTYFLERFPILSWFPQFGLAPSYETN